MHFASVVVVACAAIASARSRAASFPPWAPERELAALSKASAPWADGDGRARVRRELQRSVDALRPRETVADVSALVGEVLRNSGDLILDGRIFAHAHKPGAKDKRRGLAVMLKSATRYVALPNVAWYANEGSGGSLQDRDCRNVSVPFTVIAKKFGYASDCGILVPNPYFGNPGWINDLMGSLESWHHHASALRAAAAARPLATRIPKAFWRGKLLNHEGPNAHAYKFNDGRHVEYMGERYKERVEAGGLYPERHGDCEASGKEDGDRARLLGVSLTVARPDIFDVKCHMFDPPKNFTCVPDAAAAAELERARDAVLKHSKALYEDEFLHQGNYTRYKYALNLPGQTSGSYSRNLNHLWSIGAGVLLWDSSIVEWYYPALTTGETHVAVNRSTAIPVLDRLEGDMKEVAKLVAGAQRVHGQHMCARCIAQYWRDVFAAIRARVRYDLVLDDKTKVLAVVEAEGACDVYHEVAVSFPADDKHNYHGSIAYYKNHKPTVSRGVGLCDWLRRERKQEKVRVVR